MRSDKDIRFFRLTDLIILFIAGLVLFLMNISKSVPDSDGLLLMIHTASSNEYLPLDRDTSMKVDGNLGQMEIEIDSSRARISESPCPGQDCVRKGWLTSAGDLAICVPSGVFICIEHESSEDHPPDAVTY